MCLEDGLLLLYQIILMVASKYLIYYCGILYVCWGIAYGNDLCIKWLALHKATVRRTAMIIESGLSEWRNEKWDSMDYWNWKWNWSIPLYQTVNSNSNSKFNSIHFGSIPIPNWIDPNPDCEGHDISLACFKACRFFRLSTRCHCTLSVPL